MVTNFTTLFNTAMFQEGCDEVMDLAHQARVTGAAGQSGFMAVVLLVHAAKTMAPADALTQVEAALEVAYLARASARGFCVYKEAACQKVIEGLTLLHRYLMAQVFDKDAADHKTAVSDAVAQGGLT